MQFLFMLLLTLSTETARIVGMNDALAATEEELDKIIEKAIQEMRNESVSVSIKSNNDEDR